jgi:hypothetical protein
MKRLLLTLALLLTAACGAPSAPTATPAPAETVNPPISTPSQVTLLLSDPFTEQDVKVTFDLPEGWQITAGLSNTRIVVIPTSSRLAKATLRLPSRSARSSARQLRRSR